MAVLAFTALIAAGQHRLYPVITLTGLLVNIGLNLWLIPRWNFEGAAWATLATEVLVAGLLLFVVARLPEMQRFGTFRATRVVAAMAVSWGSGLLLAWLGVPWPVGVALSSMAFGAIAWASGYPALLRDFLAT